MTDRASSNSRWMMRLGYHGGPFRGFAPNDGVPTVAGVMAEALATVVQHRVVLTCAGRTDSGVHATDQVVHFDTPTPVDPVLLRRSLNSLCRPHIVVYSIDQVDFEFDARFSCVGRTYRYRVLNQPDPDPFRREFTWRVSGPLHIPAMNEAAGELLGTHDFSSFCRRQFNDVGGERIEKTRMRDLRVAEWSRAANNEVHLVISASAFCQQMVRSIAGLCVEVGLGRVDVDSVAAILAAKDRNAVPRVAPPQGLYLERVDYPSLDGPTIAR